MTKEDIKTIIDIVHKTIYGFFDVCDEEETPMTDKDELLLKINKAICTNIKALEQEPCEDCVRRQEVLEQINCWIGSGEYKYTNATYYLTRRMQELPPVTPQPNTDVLDKIRSEIEQITDTMGVSYNQYVSKIDVLQIIDKHMTKEGKE